MDVIIKFGSMIFFFIVTALIAGFVGSRALKRKQRQLESALDVAAQAVAEGRRGDALNVLREVLRLPCTIKGLRKNVPNRILEQTLERQLDAARRIKTIYDPKPADVPSQIEQLTAAIESQRRQTRDDSIYSFVHGGPKKEIVSEFNAAQDKKLQIINSLPEPA